MKNEMIVEFFRRNKNELENLMSDAKLIVCNKNKTHEENSFIFLGILNQYIKINQVERLILELKENEILDGAINSEILNSYILEEKENILIYFAEVNKNKNNLVDFEWKFVGLSTLEKFDIGEIQPKIIIKLKFSDLTEKIIETDFAGFKKLQEEIEEGLQSFNSTYAKRIETFAK